MKTSRRKSSGAGAVILILLLLFIVLACIAFLLMRRQKPEPDPHEGQVYLYDGFDWVWMTPLEGVPANSFTADMFSSASGRPEYLLSDYQVLRGIDVSEHQHEIDWNAAAGSGIDYAYIRVGRRGYTEGGMFIDPFFEANIKGARSAHLKCGVYFFSQAVTVLEAIEEANFLLTAIEPYDTDLPVVFDWEKIDEPGSRSADISSSVRTDCAVAFCETVRQAGYEACVYFNRNIGYYGYDLSRLTPYKFWFSLPESPFPNFYYACDMWQYSFTENVPGIDYETDMNLMFIPLEAPSQEALD